ncbi:MAG: sulfide/dihydroorotate dehydrogenase-like FAD/NAD-binding protein [Acidimicrobiales bacterium]|nr:MAG: sulfide/dihydroorotate dehydrogenase-like FAD/NAD-binding protein [Acidimicrobiales bacterium]
MNTIVESRPVASEITLLRIAAPKIARKHRAGQFVMVRVAEVGERIPLTIADSDPEAGTITIVVQAVGKTTEMLTSLGVGDEILDLAGPLGTPSEVEDFGTVIVVGGGVGTAVSYPTAVALSKAGNSVISIIGGRSQENLFFEDELAAVSTELHVCTDDGSAGRRGLVTDALADVLAATTVDRVLCAGPVVMMEAVAEVTRPYDVPTVASLNPIMVDGTGMCGGCRVSVDGTNYFACLDGPDFDAHLVDFPLLAQRNRAYVDFEAKRREAMQPCAAVSVDVEAAT